MNGDLVIAASMDLKCTHSKLSQPREDASHNIVPRRNDVDFCQS